MKVISITEKIEDKMRRYPRCQIGLPVGITLLEKSGEITPERMERWKQSENNAQCGCDW